MGFFTKWKKEKRAEQTEGMVQADDVLLQALFPNSGLNKEKMLGIPMVASCIQKLAGDVARLPIQLFQKTENGEITEKSQDNRLRLLNIDTGDTLTTVEFWKNMLEDYYLGKGGFAYIDKKIGQYVGLYHVQEEKISIIPSVEAIYKNYIVQVEGKTYFPYQFLKIRRRCRDGACSTPLWQEKPLLFENVYETLKFEKKLVQKGGNKRGFIEVKSRLTDQAMDNIKEAWANLYSNDSDKIVILNDGAKFNECSNTSVEMQLNERKESTNTDICMLFGFSARILQGGATDADRKQYMDALMELLNTIEASLNKDLLLEKEKGSFYFAFDTRELTRGNLKERYEAYEIAVRNNFMQVDEIRKKENNPPLGFNFMKLGLNDVLLDLEKQTVYTPNMNAVTDLKTMKGGEGNED